jgi:hypothetical protein
MCDVWLSVRIRYFCRYFSRVRIRNIKLSYFTEVQTRTPLALTLCNYRRVLGLLLPHTQTKGLLAPFTRSVLGLLLPHTNERAIGALPQNAFVKIVSAKTMLSLTQRKENDTDNFWWKNGKVTVIEHFFLAHRVSVAQRAHSPIPTRAPYIPPQNLAPTRYGHPESHTLSAARTNSTAPWLPSDEVLLRRAPPCLLVLLRVSLPPGSIAGPLLLLWAFCDGEHPDSCARNVRSAYLWFPWWRLCWFVR